MSSALSLRSSRRVARPGCEALEGRTLLSASGLGLMASAAPLVAGQASLSPGRITAALAAVAQQLATPAPAGAQGPITVDLNHDGVPDTISLWQPPGTSQQVFRVVYGSRPGLALKAYEMALDAIATRLVVGDFDGDGQIDVFAQQGVGGVGTLLLGKPDGTFDAYRQGDKRYLLAAGDPADPGVNPFAYDDNAQPPLQTSATAGSSSGAFTAPPLSASQLHATEVQLADLRGDGVPGLVAAEGDGSVQFYAGLGGGKFSSQAQSLATVYAGAGPVHVAFGKLAGQSSGTPPGPGADASLDMVVANTARSEITVFCRKGSSSMFPTQVMHVGLAPSAITIADVYGNGIPDLVVTCAGSETVWILRGLGNGQFDAVHPEVLYSGADPIATYLGHFGDPKQLGLAVLNRESDSLTYYANPADPSAVGRQISTGGLDPSAALVRDVNGDGYSDLVVANHDDGRVTLLQGGKDGLQATQTIDRQGTQPIALAAGPGLTASQFYILDEGSSQPDVLSFNPSPASQVTDQAGPPALESSSSITLQLQTVSEATAELVPTLLFAWKESESSGIPLGGPPTGMKPTPGVGHAGAGEDEPAPEDKFTGKNPGASLTAGAGETEEIQRFLLGVDEVPPPPLEGFGVNPPAALDARQTSAEPAAPATTKETAGPNPGREEGPPTRNRLPAEEERSDGRPVGQINVVGVLRWSDLLLGGVVLFGPVGLNEPGRPSRGRPPRRTDRCVE